MNSPSTSPLAEIRALRGLTQPDLAVELGVPLETIQKCEAEGKRPEEEDDRQALARYAMAQIGKWTEVDDALIVGFVAFLIAGTPLPTSGPEETLSPHQLKRLRERADRAEYELEATRDKLREVCEDFGFNGWNDYTPLYHVVEHYLKWHLENDCTHEPGTHRCALCDRHSAKAVFGKSPLLEEKTGDEGERWVCQDCIDQARREFYGEGE